MPSTPTARSRYFPPVTVRTVDDLATPALAQTADVGELVHQSRGDEQSSRSYRGAVGDRHREAVLVAGHRRDLIRHDGTAVRAHLGATLLQQLSRRDTLAAQQAVHAWCRCVARAAGVDHGDRSARSAQHQRAVQPGGTAADHHYVIAAAQLVDHHNRLRYTTMCHHRRGSKFRCRLGKRIRPDQG